ncbi:hypothetical protein [Salsipaludibacter albus]|uniref:hypothetical protein n=1 Tax=Salsipaludibacter albus TaxID=2849650 RepID=UPI001EE4D6BC|nr:hypothetical protein [Salsipaludibacter albus]MBY5161301.1 hypothetical protein [Salsipaludibacter albus]
MTVTRPDGEIACVDVTECHTWVRDGHEFVVTATADPIADFAGFEGDCDVDSDRCTTTYDRGSVTARFHTPVVPIAVQVASDDPWMHFAVTEGGWGGTG